MTSWIHLKFIILDTVGNWVFLYSLKEERLFEPLNTFSDCCDCSSGNFSIDTIFKALTEMTLNCLLVAHHSDIFIHLLMLCKNDTLSFNVKLRSSCSTKDLLNIEYSDIFVASSIGIVNFGTLYQNTISR